MFFVMVIISYLSFQVINYSKDNFLFFKLVANFYFTEFLVTAAIISEMMTQRAEV